MTNTNTTIALVTGASHGIGLEVARQLAQHGMTVILTAPSTTTGEAATKQLTDEGFTVYFKPLDISSEASVQQLASEV